MQSNILFNTKILSKITTKKLIFSFIKKIFKIKSSNKPIKSFKEKTNTKQNNQKNKKKTKYKKQ